MRAQTAQKGDEVMSRRRKRRYVRWRPRRSELGFQNEASNPRPYPFNELDLFQTRFLAAVCDAPSPRAAMWSARIEESFVADWVHQPAFYMALHITLRRRFGADEAGRRLTVMFRFLLSRPISDACSGAGPRRTIFFSQED
jgi:hypothetical protein